MWTLFLSAWLWDPPPPPPPPPTLLDEWREEIIWAAGWLGFVLSLLVTQMPTALSMAVTQTLNNATFCLQYALLGAWGGCSTQVIGVTNGVLKIGAEGGSGLCKTLQKFTPFALIPLGAYTYSKPLDLLPLSAVAGRLVSFQATDMFTVRMIQLVALLPWVPYALALEQTSALLTAILSIGLQLLAIWSNHRAQLLGGGQPAVEKKETKKKKKKA